MTAPLPLSGKRILVTRARHQAGQLSAELARLGATPIEIAAIEILPPESFHALDAALANLDRYQWLIVSSANAVHALRDRASALGIAPAGFSHLKVAAVGSTTARVLGEAGLTASITPREYVAESLLEALPEDMAGSRVLIARAAIARDMVPDALSGRGAHVDIAEAYRTVLPPDSVSKMAEALAGLSPHAATFASSSAVANFFALLRAAGYEQPPNGILAVSIGPITSQTLRDHGWAPAAEADPHDIPGLAAATVRALNQEIERAGHSKGSR